jgi:hypothetical protein
VDNGQLEAAHYLLRPFMLRRVKDEVECKLPPKLETRINCPLSEFQTVRGWGPQLLQQLGRSGCRAWLCYTMSCSKFAARRAVTQLTATTQCPAPCSSGTGACCCATATSCVPLRWGTASQAVAAGVGEAGVGARLQGRADAIWVQQM